MVYTKNDLQFDTKSHRDKVERNISRASGGETRVLDYIQ